MYHIVVDVSVPPVQHPPRRVPVPLREALKDALDELVQQDIVAPVQQPTPWNSSVVVVPKKDGKPRVCLDPRDLNKAIRREHYPLPTIEDIATRLHGAKVFTVLDVWHVELDEDSSFLTTFNTGGRGCRSVSALPQKCFRGACISSLRGCGEWRWWQHEIVAT